MKLIHQLNDREIPLCLLFNRVNHWRYVGAFFGLISRLGDGVIWYALMLVLPFIYGLEALKVSSHMALVAIVGLLIYRRLKSSTERIRPYNHNGDIFQNVAALDKFSFPSGHTLHAVSFTWVVLSYYPEFSIILVPFAALVALSRVVLGLHYPSDVIIGAVIGGTLAHLSFLILI